MLATLILLIASASPIDASVAPIERKTVSLELANILASEAIASCKAIGKNAVVAVVDRGGNLVALQRGDDVGPHNTLAAQRKAFTALSAKNSTSALATLAVSDPSSRNLTTVPELLLLGGGLPLMVGSNVIGGIGVAGAGGSVNDERCANEAIAKILPASGRARDEGEMLFTYITKLSR